MRRWRSSVFSFFQKVERVFGLKQSDCIVYDLPYSHDLLWGQKNIYLTFAIRKMSNEWTYPLFEEPKSLSNLMSASKQYLQTEKLNFAK